MSDDVIIGEADLDEILKRLDQGRHPMHQGHFFIALMKQNPMIDYAWIETRLRSIGCPHLYLLALPLETAPVDTQVVDLGGNRFEARFWIWHSVNGLEERAATMAEYGLPDDDAQNLENLKFTGSLVI